MSTLLGIPDLKVTENHETNYLTNKIGGTPNYYLATDISCPVCPLCRNKVHLIVQLYCPLDSSDFHRTLYVFACSNPSCWNSSESWIVYRCQSVAVAQQQQPIKPSHNTFTADWGSDGDDWGSDTEDWGTSNDNPCVNALGDRLPGSQDSNKESFGANCLANEENSRKPDLEMQIANDKKDASEDTEEHISLETMCIEDVDDGKEDPAHVIHVLSEDIQTVPDSVKFEMLSKLMQSVKKSDGRTSMLQSYFINVFEESEIAVDTDKHVSSLLEEYERKEGQNVTGVSMETGSSGGGNTEKYEKTSLKHGDVLFHKFMKQIALYPEQCIRYSWNGSPLYMRRPAVAMETANRCHHCKGEMVFELQLMPALVNLMKFENDNDIAVEFGTVLIFTCRNSCWTAGDQYRRECVVVQSDPDQDKFK